MSSRDNSTLSDTTPHWICSFEHFAKAVSGQIEKHCARYYKEKFLAGPQSFYQPLSSDTGWIIQTLWNIPPQWNCSFDHFAKAVRIEYLTLRWILQGEVSGRTALLLLAHLLRRRMNNPNVSLMFQNNYVTSWWALETFIIYVTVVTYDLQNSLLRTHSTELIDWQQKVTIICLNCKNAWKTFAGSGLTFSAPAFFYPTLQPQTASFFDIMKEKTKSK